MTTKKPEESLYYNLFMRGTCPNLDTVNIYTDRRTIEVNEVISFDIEFEQITAISYLLSSLLSSTIITAIKELKQNDIFLDEIEGTVQAQLTNPLRMIPVRGYSDPSLIKDIRIKLFYYADTDDCEKVSVLMRNAQLFNPVYQLIDKGQEINLNIEFVL